MRLSLLSQGERRYLKEDEATEYELPQQSHVDVSPAYYSNSSVPRSEEVRALVLSGERHLLYTPLHSPIVLLSSNYPRANEVGLMTLIYSMYVRMYMSLNKSLRGLNG